MVITKEQLPKLGEALAQFLVEHKNKDKATTLTLTGDLGAGKTTLIQHIAAALGVRDSVVSPTFIVMRKYATTTPAFAHLIHIDAYRIETAAEIPPLKIGDIFLNPDYVVCIEWPERLFGSVPEGVHGVSLMPCSEESRELTANSGLLRDYLQTKFGVV